MSELTKIFSILFKNLSDAFLSTASELNRLDSAPPLSQAEQKQEFISIKRNMPTKMWSYHPRDKVIVKFADSESSLKMRVLKKLSDSEYLVYHQRQRKDEAVKATTQEILGLDPDR